MALLVHSVSVLCAPRSCILFSRYDNVPDARRKKLDDKSDTMIFVSYHKTKAYRLFNLIRKKIIISRDIIIDENEAWYWTSNNTGRKPLLNSGLGEKQEVALDGASPGDIIEDVPEVNQRPQIKRMPQAGLQDCEVIADKEVIEDGDLVNFALLADVERINHDEALKSEVWKNAMIQELTSI